MYYVSRGSIPPTRHTQHRASDGSLYAEELFGVEGFTGRSSLLYHVTPPTRTHRIEPGPRVDLKAADDGLHRHRLTKTGAVEPKGDVVTGRIPLYFNHDVVFGIVRPAGPMPENRFYRNGIADEMLFVHEGTGVCRTVFGDLAYGPGDYLVLPIGTTWRLDPDEGSEQRILYLEAPSEIEPPKRYRNDYGQLLEHSPYGQRDLHAPEFREPLDEHGDYVIDVRSSDRHHRVPLPRTTRSTSSAGTATCGRSGSTSRTSSRSPAASTSRRRCTRRSRPGTSWCARSCPASSTTTRSRSRRPTTIRTSTATRSSTTSPATS